MSNGNDGDLSRLITGLEEAKSIPGPLAGGFALGHVLIFLVKKGVPLKTLSQLFELSVGLADLEMGKNPPIFERSQEKLSGPRGRLFDEMGKTWAAAALELLMSAKVRKEDAAKRVHQKIRRLEIGDYKTTWVTICSWRDRIKREKADNPQTISFRAFVETARKSAQDNPMGVANRFLSSPPPLHPIKKKSS